jgi:hypothetical protein
METLMATTNKSAARPDNDAPVKSPNPKVADSGSSGSAEPPPVQPDETATEPVEVETDAHVPRLPE